jgi:hypothetical protein
MKVIINDQVYYSRNVPIMIVFDDFNKEDISKMKNDEHLYFEVPENFTDEQTERFVRENYDSNWTIKHE